MYLVFRVTVKMPTYANTCRQCLGAMHDECKGSDPYTVISCVLRCCRQWWHAIAVRFWLTPDSASKAHLWISVHDNLSRDSTLNLFPHVHRHHYFYWQKYVYAYLHIHIRITASSIHAYMLVMHEYMTKIHMHILSLASCLLARLGAI